MTLQFTQQPSGTYAAYATVHSRFTISLKRKTHGEVRMYVSSTEGGDYTPWLIPAFKANESLSVEREFSFDSVSSTAPKYLKIVSWAEIETASLVESGVISGNTDCTADLAEIKDKIDRLDGTTPDTTPDVIDTLKEMQDFVAGYKPVGSQGDSLKEVLEKETAVVDDESMNELFPPSLN